MQGAKQSEMAIVGGETAVLPDVISGDSENAFDLAGTVMGVVKEKPILGSSVKQGKEDKPTTARGSGLCARRIDSKRRTASVQHYS